MKLEKLENVSHKHMAHMEDAVATLEASRLKRHQCKAVIMADYALDVENLSHSKFYEMDWEEVIAWVYNTHYDDDNGFHLKIFNKDGMTEVVDLTCHWTEDEEDA